MASVVPAIVFTFWHEERQNGLSCLLSHRKHHAYVTLIRIYTTTSSYKEARGTQSFFPDDNITS